MNKHQSKKRIEELEYLLQEKERELKAEQETHKTNKHYLKQAKESNKNLLDKLNASEERNCNLADVRRAAIDECYDKFIECEDESDFTKWMNEQLADA